MLVAPPGWGKTRSLYEAAVRVAPDATVVRPRDTDAVRRALMLAEPYQPRRATAGWIIWLDSAYQYLRPEVIDRAMLRTLLGRGDHRLTSVVVVVSMSPQRDANWMWLAAARWLSRGRGRADRTSADRES